MPVTVDPAASGLWGPMPQPSAVPSSPWQVHDTPITASMHLAGHHAPCRMWCAFCPRSFDAERHDAPTDPDTVQGVVDAFVTHLATVQARELSLVSDDILAFPGLLDLIDEATAHGRTVVLGTPGLRLADEALVRDLAQRGVTVALTALSTDAHTTHALVGNPTFHRRLRQALQHARTHGLSVRMQVVVTSRNLDGLADLLADLHQTHGLHELVLHSFYPDVAAPPEAYLDLFPALDDLHQALRDLDARTLAPPPRLLLGNLPWCQLDLTDLPGLEVVPQLHAAHHNAYDHDVVDLCATCAARDRCVGLHPGLVARHGAQPFDAARLDHALRLAAPPSAPVAEPTRTPGTAVDSPPPEGAILPGQGIPRDQGILPGEGLLPDAPRPRPTAHPHGPPPNQRIPRNQGRAPGTSGPPPNQQVPRQQGVPEGIAPGEGLPRGEGRLPRRRPPRCDDAPHRWPLRTLVSHGPPMEGLAWSPDGRWLAATCDGRLHTWDTQDRAVGWVPRLARALGRGRAEGLPRHRVGPAARGPLCWTSPDALLTGTHHATLQALHLHGRQDAPWPLSQSPTHLGQHPDGRLLVGGQGLTVQTGRGRDLTRWLPTSTRVTGLSVHADGSTLATLRDATPQAWDAEGHVLPLPIQRPLRAAVWSPGGRWIVGITADTVRVWDRASGRLRWQRRSGPHLRHVAVTDDDRHVLAIGGAGTPVDGATLRVWNIDAGMRRGDLLGHAAPVTHLALAPGGRLVATADTEGAVLLWDLTPELSGRS